MKSRKPGCSWGVAVAMGKGAAASAFGERAAASGRGVRGRGVGRWICGNGGSSTAARSQKCSRRHLHGRLAAICKEGTCRCGRRFIRRWFSSSQQGLILLIGEFCMCTTVRIRVQVKLRKGSQPTGLPKGAAGSKAGVSASFQRGSRGDAASIFVAELKPGIYMAFTNSMKC